MFVVSLLRNFFEDTLTSSNIPVGVKPRLIISIDQSVMSLLNLEVSKPSTHQELLSDRSIYLTVFHMIGRSNIHMIYSPANLTDKN